MLSSLSKRIDPVCAGFLVSHARCRRSVAFSLSPSASASFPHQLPSEDLQQGATLVVLSRAWSRSRTQQAHEDSLTLFHTHTPTERCLVASLEDDYLLIRETMQQRFRTPLRFFLPSVLSD